MQKPSVGRIVHYVSYGTPGGEYTSECRAAVVVDVLTDVPAGDDGNGGEKTVDLATLCVLNPSGIFFNECEQDEGDVDRPHIKKGGTWHWPERVE